MAETAAQLDRPSEPFEVVRARAIQAAQWEADQLDHETDRLAGAMRQFLEQEAPLASGRLARLMNVDGLAVRLVHEVDRRNQRDDWLPLSRDKAASFLAAVAFHESSWRWRDPRVRGRAGEGCAFQVAPSTAHMLGYRIERLANDFNACLDAALAVMRLCAERCGETPAERWMGCYASAGRCGAAPDVVGVRFETTRRLLAAAGTEK